jgi:hypothetical protein
MTQFQTLSKFVLRHSYTPGSLYPDGKNCAVPSLHQDYFVAKDETQWLVLRQVTPTNFIAGPSECPFYYKSKTRHFHEFVNLLITKIKVFSVHIKPVLLD